VRREPVVCQQVDWLRGAAFAAVAIGLAVVPWAFVGIPRQALALGAVALVALYCPLRIVLTGDRLEVRLGLLGVARAGIARRGRLCSVCSGRMRWDGLGLRRRQRIERPAPAGRGWPYLPGVRLRLGDRDRWLPTVSDRASEELVAALRTAWGVDVG